MKVLALDLSSKTGWALFNDGKLIDRGLIQLDRPIVDFAGGKYPWNYMDAARAQAQNIVGIAVNAHVPDVIVIEETNRGKNRYTQKFLEFLHYSVLDELAAGHNVVYISTGVWRKRLGMQLSKEDKKNNATLAKAKRKAEAIGAKVDRTGLGIRGRIGKKHLAVRYVNATYGLNLKMKDNDIADAICLGTAYLLGCDACDGRRDW